MGLLMGDQQIAVFYNTPVGAASCVGILQKGFDSIWDGKLVLFGTCGVLDQDIEATSIIIQHLLQTEGTSATIFGK